MCFNHIRYKKKKEKKRGKKKDEKGMRIIAHFEFWT